MVIRNYKATQYSNYNYTGNTASNTRITDWYLTRLKPIIGEDEVTIIDCNGSTPYGRTNIETVRNSYIR